VQSLTLAHISDLHIGPLPRPGLRHLAGKRATGFLSWRLRRHKIHRPEVLDILARDIAAQKPDHVAVTGDLVNIALPLEFQQARRFLERLGSAEHVTVIPGNHDAYVPLPWAQSLGLWEAFMTGTHAAASENEAASGERAPRSVRDFPFLRRRDGIAIIALSTALPTRPFSAAGELGPEQLEQLDQMLAKLGQEGAFRVVLIHHPPFSGGAYRRKSLRDSGPLAEVIARRGAELVLHGHMHVSSLGRLKGPLGPVPVIGVPSASAVASGAANHKDPSRYHLYSITQPEEPGGPWKLDLRIRELSADGTKYVPAGALTLLGGDPRQDPESPLVQQPQCA
jgi:3',5'-cyclic AMP phosphodiesterase CpdA